MSVSVKTHETEGAFSINIYACQTDQWQLKRSRADDDECPLYVLIKSDHNNELQMTHLHTSFTAEKIKGINSLIMLNLS